jgi:hypothetical protein
LGGLRRLPSCGAQPHRLVERLRPIWLGHEALQDGKLAGRDRRSPDAGAGCEVIRSGVRVIALRSILNMALIVHPITGQRLRFSGAIRCDFALMLLVGRLDLRGTEFSIHGRDLMMKVEAVVAGHLLAFQVIALEL